MSFLFQILAHLNWLINACQMLSKELSVEQQQSDNCNSTPVDIFGMVSIENVPCLMVSLFRYP